MLRRLVEDSKPDYFAVVFDAPGKTFRDDWYPEYKAHRAAMPSDLALQIEPLHELIRVTGWPLVMIEGVEADDVIGTLAHQAEAEGVDTIISTGDKDLAQLVTPRVTLVNTMSNETLDVEGVRTKFGVGPEQFLDLLTLTGDAIDNIPGVAKVGPKTAAKWLSEHGSVEAVIANAHKIGGVVGDNLRAAVDWLPQGKRLLTVKTDCSLPIKLSDLVVKEALAPELKALYERFEFKSWLRDLEPPARPDARDVLAGVPTMPRQRTPEYRVITDEAELDACIEAVRAEPLIGFDVQSRGRQPLDALIVGVALGIETDRAVYIPVAHDYAGAPDQLSLETVLSRLKPWFEDHGAKKVAHQVKQLEHVLANHGIRLAGVAHDTMLESYVLESNKPHDLDALVWRVLDIKSTLYSEVAGKGANEIGFEQVALDNAAPYSAGRADIALQLHGALYPRIERDPKLAYVYSTIELPTREVLFAMERTGVLIDAELLAVQGRELGERILALEDQAYQLAGQPFNMGSPKQIGEILFERMQLPVTKKTVTGQPSTDEEVLQALAADYPLPKLLLEHRGLCKLKSTYADKLPAMVNPKTGRVHTFFGQATAVTGRLASTDPNVQNIPVRTPEGRRIREAFIAPPGHVILSADYSQIELRIMAHLSHDESLVRAFAQGEDIHRATAAEIFEIAPDQVTSQQRSYIKAVNFGLIYGMSAFGLSAQLGIERAAAQQYMSRYFARYPGVAEYMQRTRELARAQGFVETVFGRRLWLPDIKAGGGPRRQAAERAAINAPMQGTAADLIKLAMVAVHGWIERECLQTRLVLQVHDELVLEVPDAELARVRSELPGLMTGVATLSVPLAVDTGVGPNWEQAH